MQYFGLVFHDYSEDDWTRAAMKPLDDMQAAIERITAKHSQDQRLSPNSPKRRRSYPAGEHRVHVSRHKRASDDHLQSQDAKRRRSYPVSNHQHHVSKRRLWGYDVSRGQSAQRRRFSLLRYHQVLSSRRSLSIDNDIAGKAQAAGSADRGQELDGHHDHHGIYCCSLCPKVFHNAGSLDAHVRQDHHRDILSSQEPKRKPSVVIIEDGSAARTPRRKVSVIIIDNDDDGDDPAGRKSNRKEYIFIDDFPPTPRQRRRMIDKPPRSPKAKKGDPKEASYCAHCLEKFDTVALKQDHLARDHPDAFAKLKARCWLCSFRFRSIRDLTAHVEAAHTEAELPGGGGGGGGGGRAGGPVRVECFVCAAAVAKSGLRQHVRNHHPQAWNQGFKLEKMQKRYCPACARLIREDQRNLKAHIQREHPQLWNKDLSEYEMLVPEAARLTTRWASCPVCNRRYDAGRLEKHLELKHA